MGLLAMSSTELGRVGVLRDVDANQMTPADAASVLNLSERQVFRLLQAQFALSRYGNFE